MRWKNPIITAAVGALLVTAACGGGGDDSSGSDEFVEAGSKGSGIDETRVEGPAPEIEGAQEGGTVKVYSDSGLNTMLPPEAYYTNTGSLLTGMITRTLTQYVYDPESDDFVLIPDLATAWEANEDNTEWTFTIREGIKYEDGTPVKMEDFATAVKLSMDRATFPEGPTYSNDFFLHGGCDPNDKQVYEGYFSSGPKYDGVEIDGNKLTIKMACPFPDMPYWGSFPAMSPIPENRINTQAKLQQYENHPLSTGPYMFDKYTPEKELTLVRNPHWDPASDPGRHAYPDEYVMDFDTDTAKIDNIMLEDSEPNALTYDDVLASTYSKMKRESPDRLVVGGVPCTWYLAPDYRKITEIEVRQALAYGFPYKAYLLAKGEVIGVTAQFATSNITPPGIPEREELNILGLEPGERDPEKAKELLEQAGYEPGEYEVTWLYQQDDPEAVKAKDQVVKGLEEAGFSVRPVATTTEAFSDEREKVDSILNLRLAGWCSDWPTMGSWIPPNFKTTNLEKEGLAANYSVFSEEEVDQKIKEINTMDLEDQPKAWAELEKLMLEKYFPGSPIYYTGVAMARGSAVQNMVVDSNYGMPYWKDLWVQS